jgi:hypothetical protein
LLNAGDVAGEGSAHYNISNAFEDSGDIKGAIEHMQQAHACYVRCFGAEHSEAVDAQERVEQLEEEEEEEGEGVFSCRCELVVFRTEHADYGCGGCGMSVPQGTTLHGCRECDFDLCSPCAENRQRRQERESSSEDGEASGSGSGSIGGSDSGIVSSSRWRWGRLYPGRRRGSGCDD